MMMEGKNKSNPESTLHVAMFPWFAFGHISPFVQLGNKLSSHGVRVSFFSAPANICRTQSSLVTGPHVQIVPLHIPHAVQNTADATSPVMAELLKLALDQMQPQIKSLLEHLKPHLVIHDFCHQWLGPIGSQLGIKTLFFTVFCSLSASYLMVPSRATNNNNINQSSPLCTNIDVDDLKKPPSGFPSKSIHSFATFQARDFLYVYKRLSGAESSVYERNMTCMSSCCAIVYKSSVEMEGDYIDYVKTQFGKPVLLAGPVVPEPPAGELDEKWAKWLGSFPAKSVVFCSFGSETFLSENQVRELVLGLEMTGLPFLVVLNFQSNKDVNTGLPDGFEERVKERGLVCSGWVQQPQILGHESVGCFLFHAGYSSITEGIVNDCQLVLLPMKGDQFINSNHMSEELKVGVEVRREDEDGSFVKEDVCKAVKTVMDDGDEIGVEIRANHAKWRKFLLDKEVHERYLKNFVKDLKDLVFQTSAN